MRCTRWVIGAALLLATACAEEEPIIHFPDAPAPPPYQGARTLALTSDLPSYLVSGQVFQVIVELTGDGEALPLSRIRGMTEEGSNAWFLPNSGIASGSDGKTWQTDVVSDPLGRAEFSVAIGDDATPVTIVLSDLGDFGEQTSPAEGVILDLEVRDLGIGALTVRITDNDLTPAATARVLVYRSPVPCDPSLDASGHPDEAWLNPWAPPGAPVASRDVPGAGEFETTFEALGIGTGYGVLVVGLDEESVPVSTACVDSGAEPPVSVRKDAVEELALSLTPLPPLTEGVFGVTLSSGTWEYGEKALEIPLVLDQFLDDDDDPATYVLDALDQRFGWGLAGIQGIEGSLREQALIAVTAALATQDGTPGTWDLPLTLDAARQIVDVLEISLEPIEMSGHISMGPFLPHGEATGSMTVTTVSLPGGILDLTQTPFTFWSPSPFHLTFDPKGPLWSEAGGDFEAPAVAWGPLYTKAFNEIIRPHWTSLVWSPESPEELPTEAVGITFQVLFSCDKVVPALDAVDCTADRPAPEDDPSSCLTDGMWVGPVRYPRSVIQGACEALVAEHVGRIEGTLVELAALPVQGLTGAGRLVAEVCPDGTRLCGFSAAPDWQLESTGEPWVVRPTDAASLAAFREGDE